MDAKEFHAAARRIEGLQRKLCETEVERDAWKRSYQDQIRHRQEIERTREEQRNVWREMLGALPQESLTEAINRVVMTKAERDKQSALIEQQRRLLATKQTEIGALEAERDDLRKIVEMVHADLGIQRGDHVGEAISELKKEAFCATARQRMTEVRALKYSLQAEEARREIERLREERDQFRAKLEAATGADHTVPAAVPQHGVIGKTVRRNDERKAYQDGDALRVERDARRVEVAALQDLLDEQRRLLAAKQTEIGALEAERDEMKEEIKQANKEASDATARQRMTEARALKYSLQAEEARREIERLREERDQFRAKLEAATGADHTVPAAVPQHGVIGKTVRHSTGRVGRVMSVKTDWVDGHGWTLYAVQRSDGVAGSQIWHASNCTIVAGK